MNEQELERMIIRLMGDGSSYERMINDAIRKTQEADRQTKKHTEEMQSAWDKVQASVTKVGKALTILGGALTGSLMVTGNLAVNAASDLGESVNAVTVTFGDATEQILEFGKTADVAIGLSQRAFNELSVTTGTLLTNLAGMSQSDAAQEMISLSQRASDMASVFNTEVSDAMSAIGAALRGETEPIRRYGVSLDATAIAAKAMEMGLVSSKKELTRHHKTAAALAIIYEQTERTAGDFANTSDQLANQTRIQQAAFENMRAELGQKLIPIKMKLVQAMGTVMNWFDKLTPEMQDFGVKVGIASAVAGTMATSLGAMAFTLGKVIPVLKATNELLKTTNLLMNLTKAAAVGLALGGIFLVSREIYRSMPSIRDYNRELERSNRLQQQMNKTSDKLTESMLKRANTMGTGERREFLAGQLKNAEKNIQGITGQIKGLEAEAARLEPTWRSAWQSERKLWQNTKKDIEDRRGDLEKMQQLAARLKGELDNLGAATTSESGGATPEALKAAKDYQAALDMQLKTMGMTTEQIQLMRFEKEKINETDMQRLRATQRLIAKKREDMEADARRKQELASLNKSVEDYTKRLKEQIATSGMSSREAEIWRLAQKGATEEQLKAVRALDQELTAMEKAKEEAGALADIAENGIDLTPKLETDAIRRGTQEFKRLQEQTAAFAEASKASIEEAKKLTDEDVADKLLLKGHFGGLSPDEERTLHAARPDVTTNPITGEIVSPTEAVRSGGMFENLFVRIAEATETLAGREPEIIEAIGFQGS